MYLTSCKSIIAQQNNMFHALHAVYKHRRFPFTTS
nr:MAG TPA: hypothetical protein [Caudoviricetes sp.]